MLDCCEAEGHLTSVPFPSDSWLSSGTERRSVANTIMSRRWLLARSESGPFSEIWNIPKAMGLRCSILENRNLPPLCIPCPYQNRSQEFMELYSHCKELNPKAIRSDHKINGLCTRIKMRYSNRKWLAWFRRQGKQPVFHLYLAARSYSLSGLGLVAETIIWSQRLFVTTCCRKCA